MKLPPKRKPATAVPLPGVEAGDEVFFRHPKIGPHHGRVLSQGRDGCMVKDEGGEKHAVDWDRVLGVKARAHAKFKVLSEGESGAIVEDEDGNRRFMHGYSSAAQQPAEQEGDSPKLEDIALLQEHLGKIENKPLRKSLGGASVLLFSVERDDAGPGNI